MPTIAIGFIGPAWHAPPERDVCNSTPGIKAADLPRFGHVASPRARGQPRPLESHIQLVGFAVESGWREREPVLMVQFVGDARERGAQVLVPLNLGIAAAALIGEP